MPSTNLYTFFFLASSSWLIYSDTHLYQPSHPSIHPHTHTERKRCHLLHQRGHPLSTPSTGALSVHRRQGPSKNTKMSKNKTETMTTSTNNTNNKEEDKSKKSKKRLPH